jgi:polar amino acid transport system permease protein
MAEIFPNILIVGKGVMLSLQLLLGSVLVGAIVGVAIAVMRYNRLCVMPISAFVSVIRGTPLLLQLSLVYFSTPSLIGIKLSILSAGIITFGFNSAAYISEILRAGIESLPKGQFEAAITLRIPKFYMWKDIILPQVIRNILPAMVSEVIMLLKETALIATIGGMDITRCAQNLAAEQFTYFMPLCIAGAYYYLFTMSFEMIGRKIEKRHLYA